MTHVEMNVVFAHHKWEFTKCTKIIDLVIWQVYRISTKGGVTDCTTSKWEYIPSTNYFLQVFE